MSRGRDRNTVHVEADSVDQVVEDLTRDWAVDHRARWAIDSGTPATDPLAVEHHDRAPAGMRAALHHARLEAERRAVAAAIPPDPSPELAKLDRRLAEVRRDRTDLLTGQGRYAGTPGGDAARQLIHARQQHRDAQHQAEASDSWRDRRYWRKEAAHWAEQESAAETTYTATVGSQLPDLDQAIGHLEERRGGLQNAGQERNSWLAEHPEAARRLRSLDRELNPLAQVPEIEALGRAHAAGIRREAGIRPPGPDHGVEIDFGP